MRADNRFDAWFRERAYRLARDRRGVTRNTSASAVMMLAITSVDETSELCKLLRDVPIPDQPY